MDSRGLFRVTLIKAWRGLSLMAAISLAALQSAVAATTDDWSNCDPAKGDKAIAACRQLIKSGNLTPKELHHAYFKLFEIYYDHGIAEKSKGKLKEAIADFDRAIHLNDSQIAELNHQPEHMSVFR